MSALHREEVCDVSGESAAENCFPRCVPSRGAQPQGGGMEHPEGEVICVEDTRNEAELAFQVCRLLDGSEEYSGVSEYHVVPVQGEDGTIVGVQVTGIQRDEEGGSSQLPTRMFEVRRLEEPPPQPETTLPPPQPSIPPAKEPPVSEAASPPVPPATPPETTQPAPPPPQPSASQDGMTGISGMKTLYRCGQCTFSSFILSALRRHMRRHSNRHKCEICSKTFACTRELQLHLNGHMGIRPYKCKTCDMAYRTATDLLRHIRSVHTLEKPFQCCYCNYASVEASRMKVHIRSHTGERPFACIQCPFAATDAFKLRRHLRTHTGEKPYGCQLCQARFTQNTSLKMHILRKHTDNVQKESCPICNAALFGKNDVKNHIRKQHTYLETPITCRICSEEFHERYLFRQHQDVHRTMKATESKPGEPDSSVLQEKQVEEVNGQEVEISTTEGVVSWSAVPSEVEEQLCVNMEEDKQLSGVTELHGIPVQVEDGSIVQAIVMQEAQPLEAQAVHAEVYEMQHLQEVLQPLVEQHSAVIALDSDHAMQTAEPQDVTPECYPLATSTPQPPSWKGRRIQPILPEQQIEVKLHRCRECDETFATGMELVKHRKSHRLENVFKCPFCEHETTGALELILHIQVHNDDRPFHCEQCSFTTTDTFKLSRHMRTHTGEKPFSCHVCEARFTQKTSMEMHIQRKHTKELPKLSCPICGTTLTGKHSLNIHMRKQHSHLEEELQCRFCPETFRERFMLREHQKTHRNEKTVKSNTLSPRKNNATNLKQPQNEGEQGNVVELEPVAAAQADEYTFQVLPTEQEAEIHFVISEAQEAGRVTEYHVLPVQADDGSIISIHVAGLEEVGRLGDNTIHQLILGDF